VGWGGGDGFCNECNYLAPKIYKLCGGCEVFNVFANSCEVDVNDNVQL
jgi:hypothetical protein